MALERCHNEDQIRDTLKTIPQTLEETYRKVLDNIDSKDEELAREILMIICLSPVVFDAKTVAKMVNLSVPDILVEICTTSFITLLDESVQLAHFSVQEFLIVLEEGGQHHPCQFSAASGHNYLTARTASIILIQSMSTILNKTTAESNIPLLYASKHWHTHMTAAGGFDKLSPELQAKISLLFTDPLVYYNWVRAGESNSRNNEWSKMPNECQPAIHLASMMGLVQVVERLLAQGADPLQPYLVHLDYDLKCDSFAVAANRGHFDVLRTLLDKTTDIGPYAVGNILAHMDPRKLEKVELASILQRMWDLGLPGNKSPDSANEIGEGMMSRAIFNWYSAVEIMEIFIDWHQTGSSMMPQGVFLTAVCENEHVLEVLLERCEFHVSPAFLEELKSKWGFKLESGLALLAIKRPDEFPVNEELFETFAKSLSLEEMTSLMQLRKSDVHVTTYVLENAAGNKDIFPLLWPEREPSTVVTELMLLNAAANESHSKELTEFMKEHMDPQMSLSQEAVDKLLSNSVEGVATLDMLLSLPSSPLSIDETLFETISSHRQSTEMLTLLVSKGLEILITEGLVISAASNKFQAPEVVKYLLTLHGKPLPVTESAIIAAVRNSEFGADVLEILLQDNPPGLLTDKVFEEACQNKDSMLALLNRRRDSLPIDSMLLKIAHVPTYISSLDFSSADVLQVLLEQGLVNVDETVLETLAVRFHPLNALLSWKPDLAITEKAIIAGANDQRSMRVLLEARDSKLNVSEDVLIAAVQTHGARDVMYAIEHRCGPVNITENVLRSSIEKGELQMMRFVVERVSEPLIAKFVSRDIWQDADLWDYKSRCVVLVGFFKKTVSSISALKSLDLSFDLNEEAVSRLKELKLKRREELSEVPATDLASQLLIEMCYNETIEKFWEDHRFAVTDRLIEATEKNLVADKEQLKLFLEQKRG